MSECTHDCSTCGQDCASRNEESLLAQLNPKSKVRKVYAVVSGKGGVGKSTVTSMLAVAMQKRGHRTAILLADKKFGVARLKKTTKSASTIKVRPLSNIIISLVLSFFLP